MLRQGIVDALGDRMFVAPSLQACDEHSTQAQTYLFLFDHRLQFSANAKWMGATHDDNFFFDFGVSFFWHSPQYGDADKNVSHLVMTYVH